MSDDQVIRDITPRTQCPRCGSWLPDYDGFGVVRHEVCGYCLHPSSDRDETGRWRCTICGVVTEPVDEDARPADCESCAIGAVPTPDQVERADTLLASGLDAHGLAHLLAVVDEARDA